MDVAFGLALAAFGAGCIGGAFGALLLLLGVKTGPPGPMGMPGPPGPPGTCGPQGANAVVQPGFIERIVQRELDKIAREAVDKGGLVEGRRLPWQ